MDIKQLKFKDMATTFRDSSIFMNIKVVGNDEVISGEIA
jgi:hypothetical protein